MKLGNQVSIFALALALTASTAVLAEDATDTTTTTQPATTDPALTDPLMQPAQEAPAGSDVTVVDVESGTAAPTGTLADTPFASMTSEDLIGKSVVNTEGEAIGDIEDVVLDSNQKAIYAVLSVGGFLGIGSKSVAIPFDQLQIGEDEATLMSSVTEDQLSEMAEYAADAYAPVSRDAPLGEAFPRDQATLDAQDTAPAEGDMQADATTEADLAAQTEEGALQAGADIDADIEPAAGTEEATTAETTDQPAVEETTVAEDSTAVADDQSSVARANPFAEMTAEELIGKDVVNAAGENVGEISDLVISDDKAVEAVISVGGFLGIGEKDVAVPLDDLQVTEDAAVLLSGLTKESLEGMPAYEKDTWPALERDKPIYQQ